MIIQQICHLNNNSLLQYVGLKNGVGIQSGNPIGVADADADADAEKPIFLILNAVQ